MSHNKICQFEFDRIFSEEVKRLGSLATPGSYVILDGTASSLAVTFYGKEVQARCRFGYSFSENFSAAAYGKDILDLFKSFPEGKLTVNGTYITISAGHTRMNRALPVALPEPVFPQFQGVSLFRIPQNTFKDAALAAYAAAQGSTEDAAERVSIQLNHDAISIIATNGQMAVCVESPVEYDGQGEEYLLHPRILTQLSPLTCKEDAPDIYLGRNQNRYLIRFGDYEVTVSIPTQASKRLSVEAPMKAIHSSPEMLTTVDVAALSLFLDRAKLLNGATSLANPLLFMADPDNGCVYARHESGLGDIQDRLVARIEGTPLRSVLIGMSLKNMMELCSHVQSPVITLSIRGSEMPMTVTEAIGDTSIMHILLPTVVKGQRIDLPTSPLIIDSSDFED